MVSSRNKTIFGKDADIYRPERWLRCEDESEVDYEARLKKMKDADFTFGSGNRICVGRNMATVELHKVTSTLISRYEVSNLRDPLHCLRREKN